jgi:hypothetical protein
MPKVTKEFPGPSVDNPALMGQFAHTLKDRFVEMFPVRRGFTVEIEDKTAKKSLQWDVRILHGKFGGTGITIKPNLFYPQQIWVTVAPTSRFQQGLFKLAVVAALVLVAPFFLAGIFQARVAFVLMICIPIFFLVAFVLVMITTLISRLFSRLDHHFDPGLRRRILAVAEDVPLPSVVQRTATPATVASLAPDTLQALPKRSGPWPFTNY